MLESLSQRVRVLPEVDAWPELLSVLDRLGSPDLPIWDYTLDACEAAGGERQAAEPAAAAVLCLSVSIGMIDDLLDGDIEGPTLSLGPGRAANMGLALQAAAGQLLSMAPLSAIQNAASLRWLGYAGLATARGQDLDVGPCMGEEDYWRIVEAKSTPLVAAATALGGVCADCEADVIDGLAALGALLGKIVQINDDLYDAMSDPAKTDWQRPRHNLAILYALTAGHEERERFESLLDRLDEPDALSEAQLILTTSGAIGFCVYNLVDLYRQARALFVGLPLPASEILAGLLRRHIHPVEALLNEAGLDSAKELLGT